MNVLVIGASLNPLRVSHKVTRLLKEQEHDVVAIGRTEGLIGSVAVQKHIPDSIHFDVVTLYLNPENQEPYYQQIVALRPGKVIFNPGTENTVLANLLLANDIPYEYSCNLVLLRTGQFEEVVD